jgi:hypothetical protein
VGLSRHNNAFQLLTADVNAYNPDVVIIAESWLRKLNTLVTCFKLMIIAL